MKMYVGTRSEEKMKELDSNANCFAWFFAKSIEDAKKTATEMGLKNFSALGKTYKKDKDF
jgi:hypothetical protein